MLSKPSLEYIGLNLLLENILEKSSKKSASDKISHL